MNAKRIKYYLVILILVLMIPTASALESNLNGDCIVDFYDFAIFSADWLEVDPNIADPNCDFDSDGIVDANDLAVFAGDWLSYETPPAVPEKASNPDPADDATDILVGKVLTWTVPGCGEPNFAEHWDVWFGEPNSMTKVLDDTRLLTYTPTIVKGQGSYQWRVDTTNSQGTTTGDVWTFTVSDNNAPITQDGSVSAYTHIVKIITFTATDDNCPNPPGRMSYVITALPSDTNAYLQDPVSGGQSRIEPNDLPYKLSSWGDEMWFATSTVGTTHFHFKAFDGDKYSDEKQVDVNTLANPKDCISFDGQGYITVPDNNMLDLSDSRGIGFCFASRQPYCGFLKKHETGQAGYEAGLVGGRFTVNIYSATERVATIRTAKRYDDGQWANVVFVYDGTNNLVELYISAGDLIGNWYETSEMLEITNGAVSVPAGSYINDCNLIIGQSNDAAYKYEIDAIRTYTLNMTDVFRSLAAIQIRSIAGNTETYVPTPIVRFKCNYDGTNNTATQIYDDISSTHLIGTFSSSDHVKYIPFYWHWYDSAAFMHRRGK